LAALFVGAAAGELSRKTRAASAACIAFLLIPQIRFAFGEALPDPPYLCTWALSLWIAARLTRRSSRFHFALLGVALGGAMLSRFFGWALVAGIAAWSFTGPRQLLWRRGFWISFAVALAMYAPFLAYDAAHGWQNLAFTFAGRQPFAASHVVHGGAGATVRFALLAAALCVAALFVAVREEYPLLAWTAIPLPIALAILSLFETVETYWLLGPLTSLIVGIGIGFARARHPTRVALQSLLYVTSAPVVVAAALTAMPERTQATLLHASALKAGSLNDGVYMWPRLAARVAMLARDRSAAVGTDVFETNSELTYYGVAPLFVGTGEHVEQWLRWHTNVPVPVRLLFVRYDRNGGATTAHLSGAYARAARGPDIVLRFAGRPVGRFYTTWYSQPRANARAALWGND
ncbi:MAG: glycosyltransferase family 39 protein, partial [Candidatus Eremiobacteraeota bacterium]|nr:glycosyltransferase family 39 protein [Candidatus Eremiobacteraeota bacterium]